LRGKQHPRRHGGTRWIALAHCIVPMCSKVPFDEHATRAARVLKFILIPIFSSIHQHRQTTFVDDAEDTMDAIRAYSSINVLYHTSHAVQIIHANNRASLYIRHAQTHFISPHTEILQNSQNASPNAMPVPLYTLSPFHNPLRPASSLQNSRITAAKNPNQTFHPTPVFCAILSILFIVPLNLFLEFSN
jgi:hypothetical protein